MGKKIIAIVLMLILASTTFESLSLVRNVQGKTCEDLSDFNNLVWYYIQNLSAIIKDSKLTSNGIYTGRSFGSPGDLAAADRIVQWMTINSRNLDTNITKVAIGNDNYKGDNKYDKWAQEGANNKIDITDYSLEFKNSTRTATIPYNETCPLPELIFLPQKTIDTQWRTLKPLSKNQIIDALPQSLQSSYVLLDKETVFPEDFNNTIVYIEDYGKASINDTAGKIHLLDLSTTESEDSFLQKVQQVQDSGGIGFIFGSTNPSFIQNLSTPLYGLAVSPYDACIIKNYIQKGFSVAASFNVEEANETGLFHISALPGCIGTKYIGLIEEQSDKCYDVFRKFGIIPGAHSDYVGYILYNITYPNTHYLPTSSPRPFQYPPITMYSRYRAPFMMVNGTIHMDNGQSIPLWNWMSQDPSLQARFTINEKKNESAKSYSVLCEVRGKNTKKSIMISGGHHDFLVGQGASDDATGVGTMLAILKYINETKITPECNLTFVSWGGEETIDRGSGSYVYNVSNYQKNENITYMINMDQFGLDLTDQVLYEVTNNRPMTDILTKISERTKFLNKYRIYVPKPTELKKDDSLPFWESYYKEYDGIFKNPHFKNSTGITIIDIGRETRFDIARHRTGGNHNFGDTVDHIGSNRIYLNQTANFVLNLTKFLAFAPPTDDFLDCDFQPFDLCGDHKNDSVNISFNVTTNRTSWARIEACLYNITTGLPASYLNASNYTLYEGNYYLGNKTVTLKPNQKPGIYNATIKIYDDRGNLDDLCYEFIYLSPYGKPMANFDYSYGLTEHHIYFYDTSVASPGAILTHWDWNFGDGWFSTEQNPDHIYLTSGAKTVTLTVTDNKSLQDTIVKELIVSNAAPSLSFSLDCNAQLVGQPVEFVANAEDSDGFITNYTWNFGDGTYSYEENPIHSYSQSGVYSITLITTDNDGATNTSTMNDCLAIADALVDDNFQDNPSAHKWNTITKGLNDVGNGGIIYVFNGSYNPFEINKSVALYGESRSNVHISGGNPGVKIRYQNVSLSGFNISSGTTGVDIYVKYYANQTSNVTIKNCNIHSTSTIGILLNQSKGCTIENCSIKQSNIGIKIIDSTNNEISKCTINHSTYGVYVFNSSDNFIGSPSITSPYPTNCLFTLCHDSIYLKDSDHNFILGCDIDGTPCTSGTATPTSGIYLNDSENNTVSTCAIHDTTGKGVHFNDSTWNKIEHCKITWNPIGVYFRNSPENLIAQNHFGGNAEFAVYLPSNIQSNRICYNDFFANGDGTTNQSWDANGLRGAENSWNKTGNRTLTKTGPGEGNYWSDYTGSDNNQDGIGDTPYLIESGLVERNDSYPVMNPYGWCNFTQDSTLPVITNVTATPHTVGFGYNVTINASVTDNVSSIGLVKVNIVYLDHSTGNYTMECIGGSMYQYKFAGTWTVGQYNYTVWAIDETYTTNSSSGHHFHVSADATISIATLKDSYSASQYINTTDPPNPPENLTLVGRGLTWDEYYNTTSGCNVLEVSPGPINYQEENGTWTPINDSLRQLTSDDPAYNYEYRTGNERGLFGVYFKPNAQSDWPVAFTYNKSDDPTTYVVRSKLVGVGYVDPQSNWAYHYLQSVQSSQGLFTGNTATYQNVFTGTDVIWRYSNTELKEAITMSNTTKTVLQNHPPHLYGLNDASSYLVFITKLDHQNLNLYNNSGVFTGNVTISNAGVEFKDALGYFKCALPLGEAYALNNGSMRQKLTFRIIQYNGDTYLLSGLKVADLAAMTFPVVIDPTLSVNSLSNDGYIYSSSTNYNTAWTASSGTISSSATYLSIGQWKTGLPATYNIYRSFVLFNTSSLPSNAYLDSAILSLYKKDDYSTTDFQLTIQNGQPTYPHNPLQTGDYGKSHYSGNGGSLNTANFVNGRNNITLTSLNWINKTGTTKLCLRSSRDINGTTPTGSEYINVYSANAPTYNYVPKLIITYRNQSKIKNTGSTNIKGYLLIQIQYYNYSQGKWLVEKDTINETSARTINSAQQLGLDTIFNGHVRISDLKHNDSAYRVYAAFRDPLHNILRTNDGKEFAAWWQFLGPQTG
jgi:parallel beta-helix repeat protein